jgi:hypothetical protein
MLDLPFRTLNIAQCGEDMPIGMSIHPQRYGADERSSSFTTDSANEPLGAEKVADRLVPLMIGRVKDPAYGNPEVTDSQVLVCYLPRIRRNVSPTDVRRVFIEVSQNEPR